MSSRQVEIPNRSRTTRLEFSTAMCSTYSYFVVQWFTVSKAHSWAHIVCFLQDLVPAKSVEERICEKRFLADLFQTFIMIPLVITQCGVSLFSKRSTQEQKS